MKEIKLQITVYEAEGIHELQEADAALLREATKATKQSYAPYSNFNVGAAVLMENGEIIYGSNQENGAYPSGLCAERVALFYANSHFPNVPVKAIAVNSAVNGKDNDNPVFPCGDCRQVLLECENRFGKPIKVIMGGVKNIKIINSVQDLLPLSFVLKKG
ncbi:MAG: cytidine deaminase [Prevotellaceae bacterium]|jgi:cytidine deaminase|nr:cytidine deaminase [Prevotellaceae bacterium]